MKPFCEYIDNSERVNENAENDFDDVEGNIEFPNNEEHSIHNEILNQDFKVNFYINLF